MGQLDAAAVANVLSHVAGHLSGGRASNTDDVGERHAGYLCAVVLNKATGDPYARQIDAAGELALD